MSGSAGPVGVNVSAAFPSLVRQRQQFVADVGARHGGGHHSHHASASSYGGSDGPIHTGNWVPFAGHASGASAQGGAIGLPNYLPFGHPATPMPDSARLVRDPIGREGRPYESTASRNQREAAVVSEASQLLQALAHAHAPKAELAAATTAASVVTNATALSRLRVAAGVRGKLPTGSSTVSSGGGMPHFNVENFMRSSHTALSPADRRTATEVLRVEASDRTTEQLATLREFLSGVDFFSGLSDALRSDVAGIATLRTLRKDESVYEEGDTALSMFVVLSGSVGTRVRDFLKPHSGASFVAATTAAGECFGQESMGSEERTLQRTQTKVALERTELLAVDMRDYQALLRISLGAEAKAKMEFVSVLPLFEMATMRELHRIATCMQLVRLPKNTVIIKQGEPSDKVYFVESGFVRIVHKTYSRVSVLEHPTTRVLRRRTDDQKQEDCDSDLEDDQIAAYGRRAQRRKTGGKGGGAYQFERARAFNARHDPPGAAQEQWGAAPVVQPVPRVTMQPQLLDLGRLGAKWFFGEMGVLKDAPRSASVYAESNVTLMVINKEDFFTRLPPFCLRYIEDYITSFYVPSSVLADQWSQQQRWDAFKSKMIKANRRTASTAETNAKFSATLNALKY